MEKKEEKKGKFAARMDEIDLKYEALRKEADREYERRITDLKRRYEAGEISREEYERLEKEIGFEDGQRWIKIREEQDKETWQAVLDWMKYDAEVGDEAYYDINLFWRVEYEELGEDYKLYDWRIIDEDEGILKRYGWIVYKIKTGELLAVHGLDSFIENEKKEKKNGKENEITPGA